MLDNNPKKVFFITSNYLSENDKLEYALQKGEGMTNLKAGKDGEFTTEIVHIGNKFVNPFKIKS